MFSAMVEVFKTNVQDVTEANTVVGMLLQHFPGSRINFDLHDCDKVLRIEGNDFASEKVAMLVKENGFICEALE